MKNKKVVVTLVRVAVILVLLFAASQAKARVDDPGIPPRPDPRPVRYLVMPDRVTGRVLNIPNWDNCQVEDDPVETPVCDPDDWRCSGELVCPDPENPDFCYRDGK